MKHVVTAFFMAMFIIAASVTLTLSFKGLYYYDVEKMDLAEKTGYTHEEIIENYDALIKYNQDLGQKELKLTLPMSEEGRIHFEEVKHIFVFFQYIMLPIGLIGSALGIWRIKKSMKKSYHFLKWTSVFTILVPAVIGGLIAAMWDKVFVMFHKIFFNNDYWIFDPATDPIINLLPDAFFMHCAVMILILVLGGGIACFWIYKKKAV